MDSGSPWLQRVPDEEANGGDTYTVAFDHLMNDVKHSDYYYDYTRNDLDRKTHSLIQGQREGI